MIDLNGVTADAEPVSQQTALSIQHTKDCEQQAHIQLCLGSSSGQGRKREAFGNRH